MRDFLHLILVKVYALNLLDHTKCSFESFRKFVPWLLVSKLIIMMILYINKNQYDHLFGYSLISCFSCFVNSDTKNSNRRKQGGITRCIYRIQPVSHYPYFPSHSSYLLFLFFKNRVGSGLCQNLMSFLHGAYSLVITQSVRSGSLLPNYYKYITNRSPQITSIDPAHK